MQQNKFCFQSTKQMDFHTENKKHLPKIALFRRKFISFEKGVFFYKH